MSDVELRSAREEARKRGVFVNELLMMALSRLACEPASTLPTEQAVPVKATSERVVELDSEGKALEL